LGGSRGSERDEGCGLCEHDVDFRIQTNSPVRTTSEVGSFAKHIFESQSCILWASSGRRSSRPTIFRLPAAFSAAARLTCNLVPRWPSPNCAPTYPLFLLGLFISYSCQVYYCHRLRRWGLVSATASIVGIVGYGIQIIQMLHAAVDARSMAAERGE